MSTSSRRMSLQDYRIALTIAADDPLSLAADLRDHGATVLTYPVAQSLEPSNSELLTAALRASIQGDATWLLLPTPCAVTAVATCAQAIGLAPRDLQDLAIALFGATTQATAASYLPGWPVTAVHAAEHRQLIAAMQLTPDDDVVIPIAQHARANWDTLIAATGAHAEMIPAYRLLLGRGGDDIPGLLWEGKVDGLLFHTENSVRHFAIRLKAEGGTLDMLNDVDIICLDRATADAAHAFGLHVRVTLPPEVASTPAATLARALAFESIAG